jgi:hypothetical protein
MIGSGDRKQSTWIVAMANRLGLVSLDNAMGQAFDTRLARGLDLPWWLLVAAALVVVYLVVLAYRRRSGQAPRSLRIVAMILRAAMLVLVLAALQQWLRIDTAIELPELVVVVDDSASAQSRDRADDEAWNEWADRAARDLGQDVAPSRFDLAKWALARDDVLSLEQLRDEYAVRLYRLGATVRRAVISTADSQPWLEWQADEPSSRLGDGLIGILDDQAGRPTAAIVLISDGRVTEGVPLGTAAALAAERRVPMFVVVPGPTQTAVDLAITDVQCADIVALGDEVAIAVDLAMTGRTAGDVDVTLTDLSSGVVVDRTSARLAEPSRSAHVILRDRPSQVGTLNYRVAVENWPGEVATGNNYADRSVEVLRRQSSVLMVAHAPTHEFRLLREVLGRARSSAGADSGPIELATFLQLAEPESGLVDATAVRELPSDVDQLARFDLVWLGDAAPQSALDARGLADADLENLFEYVSSRGGVIAIVVGERFLPQAYRGTRLESLLPFALDDYQTPSVAASDDRRWTLVPTPLARGFGSLDVEPTDDSRSPRNVRWAAEIAGVKPTAMVLAEWTADDAKPIPAVILQRIGSGVVITHTSDESYLWRFRNSAQDFETYWLELVRWASQHRMAAGQGVARLTSRRRQYIAGEPIELTARFFDERAMPANEEPARVRLRRLDVDHVIVELHPTPTDPALYRGTLFDLAAGEYRAELDVNLPLAAPLVAQFTVVERSDEQRDTTIDIAALTEAAQVSGGQLVAINETQSLADALPRPPPRVIGTEPPRALWDEWPVALVAVVLAVTMATAEWLIGRRYGWP